MTFWRFGYHATSAIDTLLAKETVSLEEFLEEEELLQECKSHNTKLLEYLREPQILSQLLRCIITDKIDEAPHSKYAFIASEVLSCEVWTICEAIMENKQLLQEFWQYLDREPPLHPIQASYFSKVIGVFLQKITKQMLQFIKAQPNSMTVILAHMETSAIMDLLLKLISLEEVAEGHGVVDWLAGEGLIPTLVKKLDPNEDTEWHGIGAQVLLDIIAISQSGIPEQPSIGTNALIRELKGENTLNTIVDYMLDPSAPNSTSSLINGVTIFIELIRRNYCEFEPSSIPDLPRPPVDLSDLLHVLGDRVEDFQQLLVKPKSVNDGVDTTLGKAIPLGFERLKICELFAELLHCSNMGLLNMLDIPKEVPTTPSISAEVVPITATFSSEALNDLTNESVTKLITESTGKSTDATFEENPVELNKRHSFDPTGEVEAANTTEQSPNVTAETNVKNNSEPPSIKIQVTTSRTPLSISKPNRPTNIPVGEHLKARFVESRILPTCIDLFFTFSWNNFLHTVVYDMIHQILNGRAEPGSANRKLMLSILADAQLTKKITKAQRLCDYEVEQPKGLRTGYMGHVTFIADEIVNCFERHKSIAEEIQELSEAEEWLEYVQRILRETKERDRQPLGGARPATRVAEPRAVPTDDDNEEGMEAVGEGDMPSDQFARYLCQEITSDLPDKFGSSDDEDDDDDDDEVGWIGDFDRGSGFDMRAAFSSTGDDPFGGQRSAMDDSFDDSDDDDEIPQKWSPTDAPPTMAQFAAEAPHEKLTVADWNAAFERSYGQDMDANDAPAKSSVLDGSAAIPIVLPAATEQTDQSWANFNTALDNLTLSDETKLENQVIMDFAPTATPLSKSDTPPTTGRNLASSATGTTSATFTPQPETNESKTDTIVSTTRAAEDDNTPRIEEYEPTAQDVLPSSSSDMTRVSQPSETNF